MGSRSHWPAAMGSLFSGPPGAGKTLLARTIPGLLPALDDIAALEATVVASAAGTGPIDALIRRPPFRAPHHTLSYAAMVGGGPRLSPGEVTLADHGVLFLDELPEFGRDVLEALRQPLEEGRVAISRAGRQTTFPARFQLVAAMNPCPCGFAGSDDGRCRCTEGMIERYGARVSGPLRDRIDLWVSLPRVSGAVLVGGQEPERSAVVAGRIEAALARQRARPGGRLNGRLSGRSLRAVCRLDRGRDAARRPALGGRAAVGPGNGAAPARRAHDRRSRRRRRGQRRAPRRGCPIPAARGPCRGTGRLTVLGVGMALTPDGGAGSTRGPSTERDAWAVLAAVSGLGPIGLAALLLRYGTGAAILAEAGSPGGSRRLAETVREPDPDGSGRRRVIPAAVADSIATAADAATTTLGRIRAAGVEVVTLEERAYPHRLAAIELPPHVLFVRGDVDALDPGHAVAVVGTRRPSDAGRRTATRIGDALARVGATVVSGLAYGIDAEAHLAVLAAGGATVAVIGSGHARLYPAAHDRLADRIVASGGAVVSEHAPDVEANAGTFPRRNRVISGLSDAVVVVEAPARSGALITASWALEQGRDAFLVPGQLGEPASAGCLAFLRENEGAARIVAGIPQLLDDLRLIDHERETSVTSSPDAEAALVDLGGTAARIGRAVVAGHATTDELVAVSGLPVATVLSALTLLESRRLVLGAYGRYRPAGALALSEPRRLR